MTQIDWTVRTILLLLGLTAGCDRDTTNARYLAIGDSYTIGQSVAPSERFPTQLVAQLKADGRADLGDPFIVAQTGWTTLDVLRALGDVKSSKPFDLVTVLVGVNDQYQHRQVEDFRASFVELLDRAIKLAGNRPECVVVISIPDYSVTPFAQTGSPQKIAAELRLFNEVVRVEAELKKVAYVDITPFSQTAATKPTLLADDGLHPSGKMYAYFAQRIAAKITSR